MANIIPFESAKLPAHLKAAGLVSNLSAGVGGGFPVVSIKGKVFTLKRGDEKTLITRPGDDEPAGSIEVVIIDAGPEAGKTAKVYYGKTFVEGDDSKPLCYSNNSESPEADSVEPQAKKCALCPHNQWGSKVSDDGKKGRACSESKRLAIAQTGAIGDPMLIRVPAASLKALTQYDKLLATRGVAPQAVVTKIGFDYTVAHPSLTFKPVGFLDENTFNEVLETMQSDVVKQITGISPVQHDEFETAATEAPKVEKAADKPKKSAPVVDGDDLPIKVPKTKVKVEGEEAPVPKKAEPVSTDIESGMDAALDDLDFDDN